MEGLRQEIIRMTRGVRTGDKRHSGCVTQSTVHSNPVTIDQNLFPGYETKRYQLRERLSTRLIRRHDPRTDVTTA